MLLFFDGFDHYTAITDSLLGKWSTQNTSSVSLVSGSSTRFTSGQACRMASASAFQQKDLGTNYTTLFVGFALNVSSFTAVPYLQLLDSAAAAQFTFIMNGSSGLWEARRGSTTGTLLGTASSGAAAGTWAYYEFKVTVNDTTGVAQVMYNGASVLNLTGQDTCSTANVNARYVKIGAGAGSVNTDVDDFYILDTSGSQNTTYLGDVRVETLYPNADTAQKDFTTAFYTLGGAYPLGVSAVSGSANVIRLSKYTAPGNGTLGTINIFFQATSGSIKVKGVLYADSAGSPGSNLATTAEVVGVTGSTTVPTTLTFSSPPSITAGTAYWIGYITDTATNLYTTTNTDTTTAYSAANTYTSGAPGSAPAMTTTTQNLAIYGVVTATSGNYAAVRDPYADSDVSYVADSTAGHYDLYDLTNLVSNPTTVCGIQVNALWKKDDAGARSGQTIIKSGSTTGTGTATALPTSYSYGTTIVETNPDTSTAWTGTTINSLKAGTKVQA
jgi:hypothetical protein